MVEERLNAKESSFEDGTNVAKGTPFWALGTKVLPWYDPAEGKASTDWKEKWARLRARFERIIDEYCPIECVLIQTSIPNSQTSQDPAFLAGRHIIRACNGLSLEPLKLLSPSGKELTGLFPFKSVRGEPMLNREGQPVAFRLGMTRRFVLCPEFGWTDKARPLPAPQLVELGRDGTNFLYQLPPKIACSLWRNWPSGFSRAGNADDSLWWDALFELSLQQQPGDRLYAKRFAWFENASIQLIGDGVFPRLLSPFTPAVASESGRAYPSAHYARLFDVARASVAAIDEILEREASLTEIRRGKPMLQTQIPDERRGLQRIAGCDNAQRSLDIVFIHGLGGDSWTTWMADGIQTFWPNWLAEEFPQVGLWTLGYAASGSKWKEESMPLTDRGNQVLDLLANDGIGERPLVFITHSMGGIVAKQILRHALSFGVPHWEAIGEQTRGLAFIATPHSGAHIAGFAELASAVYRTNEQVKELAAHDPRLRELHGWFLNYQRTHQLICRTYCEKREVRPEIPLLGIKLPKGVLVVDETSAEPNISGERAIPLDEDHISICKPTTRDAQLYKGIVRFLRDCERQTNRPQ